MKTFFALMLVALCCSAGVLNVQADEPAKKTDAAKPQVAAKPKPKFQYQSAGIEIPAATADEPKVAAFGPETILAARQYLDDGANYWVREKNCVACHSTGVYMAERPALTPLLGKPSEEVLARSAAYSRGELKAVDWREALQEIEADLNELSAS